MDQIENLIFVTDRKRHLVCVPYTIDNLHIMAKELNIKKCWFHKNHYDIPKNRISEIEKKCQIVRPREIVEIIKSPKYASIIISDELKLNTKKSNGISFLATQLKYNGYL